MITIGHRFFMNSEMFIQKNTNTAVFYSSSCSSLFITSRWISGGSMTK